MMGVLACNIPFSDHNQSPRNCYQCLWEEEPVLMADGSRKQIKDVRVGDEVLTFDPDTMVTSTTKVTNQYVRPTEKNIVEVKTLSGRTIVTTDDHKYWTNQGWVAPKDFSPATRVGVLMTHPHLPIPEDQVTPVPVLTREQFHESIQRLQIYLNVGHNNIIMRKDIFPLHSHHPMMPALARMAGYIQTNGDLVFFTHRDDGYGVNIQAVFKTYKDAHQFKCDLNSVDGTNAEIINMKNGFILKSHFGSIVPFLLLALGITSSTNGPTPHTMKVPTWVLQGTPHVRREYCASLAYNGHYDLRTHKNKMKVVFTRPTNRSRLFDPEPINTFMTQIVEMIRGLGIEVSDIYTTTTTMGDPKATTPLLYHTVGYEIKNDKRNLHRFVHTIGYRYAHHKQRMGTIVREFERNETITDIRQWMKETEWKEDTMFIPVTVTPQPNCMIADITVESENHCFFGGDHFAVHNSAMGKQAVGIYMSNFNKRIDTMGHVLNYPQRPLARTKLAQYTNSDQMPSGVNAVIAIMTKTG